MTSETNDFLLQFNIFIFIPLEKSAMIIFQFDPYNLLFSAIITFAIQVCSMFLLIGSVVWFFVSIFQCSSCSLSLSFSLLRCVSKFRITRDSPFVLQFVFFVIAAGCKFDKVTDFAYGMRNLLLCLLLLFCACRS